MHSGRTPRGPRLGGPVQWGKWPAMLFRGARTGRARGVVTTRRLRAGRHDGVHAGGPMSANQRHGAVSGLAGATGRTSGKEEGVGAHQKGGSTVRR
jgi:hypothetical protein